MPEVPILFYAGIVITVVGVALLIYAAFRPPGPAEDTDPWWLKFLEWVNENLGPAGVVGVLLIAVGLLMTAWGWSPAMVIQWIEALTKVFGNNAESPPPPSPGSS